DYSGFGPMEQVRGGDLQDYRAGDVASQGSSFSSAPSQTSARRSNSPSLQQLLRFHFAYSFASLILCWVQTLLNFALWTGTFHLRHALQRQNTLRCRHV